MTSIRNICLDALRRRERLRETSVTTPTEAISDDDEQSNAELTTLIEQIISQLPEREREVIHLRDCEQMEFEDVAYWEELVQIMVRAADDALCRGAGGAAADLRTGHVAGQKRTGFLPSACSVIQMLIQILDDPFHNIMLAFVSSAL